MRIGELAARAGVNVETLRYYERRGLLAEPVRGPSGHRVYDEDTVRFVRAIKEAQSLGFTLAEIEEYLRAARRPDRDASEALRVRLAAKIDEVDAKLAGLRRVREDLARVVGCACDSLDHCTCGAAYLARGGRDPEPGRPTVLHVTNGDSAGNTLRRTSLGGAVLPWQDVLHEGPLPDVPPARMREVRAEFLSACGWGERRSVLAALERRDRLLAGALEERRHVVLWFEHDLYDQLQLLQVLALAGEVDWDPDRFAAIVVGAYEGRPDFHGLGELTEDELETLWPLREPVTGELVDEALAAWGAVRAPNPTELAALVSRGAPSLPFLPAALGRLLEELPDVRDGLSRTERQLLAAIDAGAATPVQAFLACSAREEAPFAGDAWVFRTLAELEGLVAGLTVPPPLGEARAFASARIELTGEGRAVLAGEADRVQLLGIDRWVGGTHLVPGAVWRRDGSELVAS